MGTHSGSDAMHISACRENVLSNVSINNETWNCAAQRIIVNTKQKLIYCPIPLVGNGPLLKLFYALEQHNGGKVHGIPSGEIFKKNNFVFLSEFSLNEQKMLLANSYKIMISRHPLSRLAAVYKLKFKTSNKYFHKHYGEDILKRRAKSTSMIHDAITFSEFLDYIVSNGKSNEHWSSQEQLCLPCAIWYDRILVYEDLVKGSSDLLKLPQLQHIKENLPINNWDHVGKTELQGLWSTVNPSIVGRVVQHYNRDFVLFGYQPVL